MKKLLSILSFIAIINPVLSQITERNKYKIIETHKDFGLPKDSAKLILKFTSDSGKPLKGPIQVTLEKHTYDAEIDTLGVSTILVKPKRKVRIYFSSKIGYELLTDFISIKPKSVTTLDIQLVPEPFLDIELKKPVIYLYPKTTTQVELNLDFKGDLLFSYPEYKNGWNVIANPNGDLTYNDRNYKYLFWEGKTNLSNTPINWNEGFYVTKDSLVSFFENSLAQVGLNENETQDFITFWIPEMISNNLNLIHFAFTKEYDKLAPLHIKPQPDNIIRVFVFWTGIEQNHKPQIKEQVFPKFNRDGFSVIEWGGTEIKNVFNYAD